MQEIPYSTLKGGERKQEGKDEQRPTCLLEEITHPVLFNRISCRISYPVAVILNILRAAPLKIHTTMV